MPATITERAAALRKQAQRKQRLQEQQERLADFQARERDFREHAGSLATLMQTYRLFEKNGIDFEETRGEVGPTLDRLRKVREQFEEDPGYIIDRQGSLRSLWKRIESHRDGLRLQLDKAWRQHVRDHAPGQDEEVLDVLGRIPDFEKPVQRIRTQASRLERKKETLPRTEEDLQAIHALSESIGEAWQSIGSGELSDDVLAFLKAAASQSGASLDLLTPGVRDWLEREGLTESFAVRVGR